MPQPRPFQHWYRGTSVDTASASPTSPPWGVRGSLGTPVYMSAAAIQAAASGGVATGGVGSAWLAFGSTSLVATAAGGRSTHALAVAAVGKGGLAAAGSAVSTVGRVAGASGGASTGGRAAKAQDQVVAAGGGLATGGWQVARQQFVLRASGGWSAGGAAIAPTAPLKADSFTYQRRGDFLSNSLASRSGNFGYSYRGTLRLPSAVHSSAVETSAVASGGLAAGGASARSAFVSCTAAPSGGLRTGGGVSVGLRATYTAIAAASIGGTTKAVLGVGRPASGGWSVGGSAGPSTAARWSASGGSSAGGSSRARVDSLAGAAGGLGVGGSSAPALGLGEAAATVAAAFGGSAAVQASSTFDASGGLVVGGSARTPGIVYRIYMNDGLGGPIDYTTAIAEVSATSWTSPPLPPASSYKFGVRSHDLANGLGEENLDASVALVVDADGRDATNVPPPPVGVRVIPTGNAGARVEWTVAGTAPSRRATRFNVYVGPDAPDFSAPSAVAEASAYRGDSYAVVLAGLTDGVRYAVSVRSANGRGEEGNTRAVFFTADATPPSRVDFLSAAPTSAAV